MKHFFHILKNKLFTKHPKELTPQQEKAIDFFNRFSFLFHFILSCGIVFLVEIISRRSLTSALWFFDKHTFAFLYNAVIVFASLTLVYLFRRRAFSRVIISGFWIILGIINGCVLSNRVTPFGFSDLKCIPDLFAMKNTSYFTAEEATLVVIGLGLFAMFCVALYIKGPRFNGKMHKVLAPLSIAAFIFIGLPVTTTAAESINIIDGYFSNIAQGYENYGFIYGFSSSVVDTGMSKPTGYSELAIDTLTSAVDAKKEETTVTAETAPNIICVLLESFCDPDEIKFLNYENDPIPTFHYLEENFSTGYLNVPVIGAGTANSEFEVLTGMQLQHFGTGEYPYKTILKKTDCESIASALSSIGYGTHAVHNNGGNFYSRVNAFSVMGFDSFTSKELMNIQEYTPTGSWPTDDILVSETIKTLDATEDQPDFTYTITVSSHGDYPTEEVITDPEFPITGVEDEGDANAWTYYVNQLHAVDNFMADLIEAVEARGEDTIIVFWGDHLPTMGLTEEDMVSGDIYKTNYVTWNNMGLEKKDTDLYAYQLLAHITDTVGIHEGTLMTYHQTMSDSLTYLAGLENLQYDILYGKRYCYGDEEVSFEKDIVMGIDDVTITGVAPSPDNSEILIQGNNFTKWSKVYVNGKKVSTGFNSDYCLAINKEDLSDGDTIVVCQVGSSSTIFRSSNEFVYEEVDSTEQDGATEVVIPMASTEAKEELPAEDILN
ncbi:MAG: sulfatase-like hydrolase/transferase [Agathobacter sp.]|nr:sulfatase-like hydrolase/transferase [Agathobacter sp.]